MHPCLSRATLRLLFAALPAALFPQTAQTPGQYDARIAYFESTGQQDSFLYYAGKKADLARQADQLELWGWIQVETHDIKSDDPSVALKNLDKALAAQWRAPKDGAEAEPLMYLQAYRGYYLSKLGRIWQAVQAYEAARIWFERYRYADFEAVETLYKPLGNHYTRLGDNEKALAIFQKAMSSTPADKTAERAGLYNNIGVAYWNSGQPNAAETAYRTGLDLPGLPAPNRALLLTGLARTQLDLGQHALACQTAGAAIRLLPTASRDENAAEYRVHALAAAGIALLRDGQLSRAERCLKDALEESGKVFGAQARETAKIYIALAGLSRAKGFPAEALAAANRALAAVLPGFRPKQNEDNPDATLFYEENSIFEALEEKAAAAEAMYHQTALLHWLNTALDCHDLAWQAEALLRRVYQYRSSKLELQQNARIREEAAMNVTRLLYEKTGKPEYREKAFALAERSKATLLFDALQDYLIRQRLAGRDQRFERLHTLRQSAAYFERLLLLQPGHEQAPQWRIEYDAIATQIANLKRDIDRSYPELADAGAIADFSFDKIKIPDQEILAEYFIGSGWIDIFILSGKTLTTWHRAPLDDSLRLLTDRFISGFENAGAILADPADFLKTAYGLWQKIVPPETAPAQRLTIVPDGFINFIPFEALVTALPEKGDNLRTAGYLIRRQEIRYAWSLATLQRQDALRSKAPEFFLGVAPLFRNGERGLSPLTAGSAEWNTIPARCTRTLAGAPADTAHFTAGAARYRILHLSTHARADLRNQQIPRIELYDAPLLLPDIYALPLQADLVVLSACQTGLGVEQKGEGVMSLARAFAQSGAACILSSLWTVNDRSTADILRDFYKELGNGKTIAAALRRAKLQYIDDKKVPASAQSPYFWAGMIAVGSNREIGVPARYSGYWFVWTGAIFLFILSGIALVRKWRNRRTNRKS
ncbi:MAG: CHAT domain-containing protein [Thermoanaerobaculia bacterium]|nr:CHAT domain-containing protein [Thermoanaerobaculia bacterium]